MAGGSLGVDCIMNLVGALRLKIKILADPERAFYQSQMRNVNFELALLKVGTQRALAFLGTLNIKNKI